MEKEEKKVDMKLDTRMLHSSSRPYDASLTSVQECPIPRSSHLSRRTIPWGTFYVRGYFKIVELLSPPTRYVVWLLPPPTSLTLTILRSRIRFSQTSNYESRLMVRLPLRKPFSSLAETPLAISILLVESSPRSTSCERWSMMEGRMASE
jgi:hypothetical protein